MTITTQKCSIDHFLNNIKNDGFNGVRLHFDVDEFS